MIEIGRDLDFAQETLGAKGGSKLGAERLDRDLPLVLTIIRQVHRRHPTAAELLLDGVAGGEGGSEARQLALHQGSPVLDIGDKVQIAQWSDYPGVLILSTSCRWHRKWTACPFSRCSPLNGGTASPMRSSSDDTTDTSSSTGTGSGCWRANVPSLRIWSLKVSCPMSQ